MATRADARRLLLAIAGAILVGVNVVLVAPGLLATFRLAHDLRAPSRDERHRAVLGDYYAAISDFNGRIPANAGVALIPQHATERDVAMLSVYQLYPRPSRVFWNVGDWLRNQHDGADRTTPRPEWLIIFDLSQKRPYRLLHAEGNSLREVASR